MQPARAVSPEVAALLPPVGLLSQSRTPPPLMTAAGRAESSRGALPTAVPGVPTAANTNPAAISDLERMPSPSGQTYAPQRSAKAAVSSAALTAAMIVTAVGVGAMAILPALSDSEGPQQASDAVNQKSGVPADHAAAHREGSTLRQAMGEPSSRSKSADAVAQSIPAQGPSQTAANLTAQLAEVRRLLREQNIAAASSTVRQLAAREWPATHIDQLEQHASLVSAVEALMANLQEALDMVGAGRTIRWRGRESPIVGVTDTTVTISVNRRQVPLPRQALSSEALRALTEGLLDMADPRNQVQLGAFLFVAEGDRTEARRLWSRAAAAGEDVSHFLPLLRLPE